MNRYFELAPPHHLRHVVECFWVLANEQSEQPVALDLVFPDGAADVVLSCGNLTIHGPSTSFRLVARRPSVGARLRRGAAKAILGISPGELKCV
jgi:hypothetical protein